MQYYSLVVFTCLHLVFGFTLYAESEDRFFPVAEQGSHAKIISNITPQPLRNLPVGDEIFSMRNEGVLVIKSDELRDSSYAKFSDLVAISGTNSGSEGVGEPTLPVKRYTVEIPHGVS